MVGDDIVVQLSGRETVVCRVRYRKQISFILTFNQDEKRKLQG